MHLIDSLSSGFVGAGNGTARLFQRGTGTAATWYTDFEASSSSTADIPLTSYGSAIVYVNGLVDMEILNSAGAVVRTRHTVGSNAAAIELISDSLTGTDYTTALTGRNKPTTEKAAWDLWYALAGNATFGMVDAFGTGVPLGIAAAIGLGQGGEFVVTKYGAVGDGTTNDTAAITAAIAAASAAGGGTVVFPPGTYKVTTAITTTIGISVRGSGAACTNLVISSATLRALSMAGGASTKIHTLKDISIYADQANTTANLLLNDGIFLLSGCHVGAGNSLAMACGSSAATTGTAVGCAFFGVAEAAAVVSYGHNDACTLRLLGCRIVAGAGAYTNDLMVGPGGSGSGTGLLILDDCVLDAALQSSGTLFGTSLSGTNKTAVVTGCLFLAPAGGTFTAFRLTSGTTATLTESGNTFTGATVPYSMAVVADLATSTVTLGSRIGRKLLVANDTAGSQTVNALDYSIIVWQRTDNGTQTPTFVIAPEGARFTLVWWNDHGAGGGTITLAAAGAIRSEFASEQFTLAANSIRMISFVSCIINGNHRWVQDGESTDDETE